MVLFLKETITIGCLENNDKAETLIAFRKEKVDGTNVAGNGNRTSGRVAYFLDFGWSCSNNVD